MPTRGYRKGLHDNLTPLDRQLYTRVSRYDYAVLTSEASARSITTSKLVRLILEAHIDQQRAALPRATGPADDALRALNRIGNNLNQLAKLAHAGLMPTLAADLAQTLALINDTARRMVP